MAASVGGTGVTCGAAHSQGEDFNLLVLGNLGRKGRFARGITKFILLVWKTRDYWIKRQAI